MSLKNIGWIISSMSYGEKYGGHFSCELRIFRSYFRFYCFTHIWNKPGYRIWIRIVCKPEIHLLLRNARNSPSFHACDQWSASASFKYFPYFFGFLSKEKSIGSLFFFKSGFIDKPPNPRIHQAFFRVFPCTKTLDNQFDCPPWWKFPNIKDGSSKQDEISYINPRQIHPPFQTVTLTGPFLYIQRTPGIWPEVNPA